MAFQPGPLWTDPRPGVSHPVGAPFPLLPSTALETHESPELHVFPDTSEQGLGGLWWPDWAPIMGEVAKSFPVFAAEMTEKYFIGSLNFRSWARDSVHLCRDLVLEVRDFVQGESVLDSTEAIPISEPESSA